MSKDLKIFAINNVTFKKPLSSKKAFKKYREIREKEWVDESKNIIRANPTLDLIEERREKEILYILYINDLTQTAVTVNTRNEFNIKTLEQIIDDDKIRYEAPTKEQLCKFYLEFIKNNSGHDLVVDIVGSIYRKVKELSKELNPIIYEYLINGR